MTRLLLRTFSWLVLAPAFAGCGPGPMYEWGGYEESLRRSYADGSDKGATTQRNNLEKEIRKAESSGKKVPPGKYAHVGYLCYLGGDKAGASKYFEAERRAFPESARLMDQMLGRLR